MYCFLRQEIKKTASIKEAVHTQKNRCRVYRRRSTDFTSLSSLPMYILLISKNTIARRGNSGSIPFSGKLIPPDKFSNQYVNKQINKTFIIILMLFSSNCLFLFLKLKILNNPKIAKTEQNSIINGTLSKMITS